MRRTLRRSCASCAKAKHSCDLRTPKCSRCVKRNLACAYANEPASTPEELDMSPESNGLTSYNRFGPVDPFDSYPPTRLHRLHVQRLMHSFLHKIAFQYYPLELDPTLNPFLISWWPLALGDPTLFHVSLQTACLDEELLARKGFRTSELLMADSVALLGKKIGNTVLAVQDGTMNSIITLAAIEFGKGNTEVSRLHIDGLKRLVSLRGGISSVMSTSPLTARMVSWVSMIISGQPQFKTQDDYGIGDGLSPVPEWNSPPACDNELSVPLEDLTASGHEVWNVFARLRNLCRLPHRGALKPTRLHDLTCFTIHRLLETRFTGASVAPLPLVTECICDAIVLYMFIIQGPTYYAHTTLANTVLDRLMKNLAQQRWEVSPLSELEIWMLSVGLVASEGMTHFDWLSAEATIRANAMNLNTWESVLDILKGVLWLHMPYVEDIFRKQWVRCLELSDLEIVTVQACPPILPLT